MSINEIYQYHQQLITALRRDEGVHSKVYTCPAGKLTIGVGRNLDDRGISDDEIDFLLLNDIKICEEELDRAIPWWRNLNVPRQHVLLNMCFNLGITRLLKFNNTLRLISIGDFAVASREMLRSKWAQQVGKRAARLSEQLFTGEFVK